MEEYLDKKIIINHANELYEQVLTANSYYSIIKQYGEYTNKYLREINHSPAFYSLAYLAFQNALFMELARIYDQSSGVINIKYLIDECKRNYVIFPKYMCEFEYDGEIIKIPHIHKIKREEECYYKEYVEEQKQLYKAFGLKDETSKSKIPIEIELTIEEYFDLFNKRYRGLKNKIENIRVQRNKIYAHNDKKLCFDFNDIKKKNPIFYDDIGELIEYGFEVTKFVILCLSGESRAEHYINIDDWEYTLQTVKIGMKYREVEESEMIRKIEDKK